MAKVMRCTMAHWQGDTLIEAGALRPEGHHEVIPIYFEVYTDVDEPAPKKTTRTPKAGQ